MAILSRLLAVAAAGIVLSGCKMTLTNRVDVQGDGGAVVHVVATVDDQLYGLAQSQGGGADNPFLGSTSTTNEGWTVTRSVTGTGDHAIDVSKHVASVEDVAAAFSSVYDTASKTSSRGGMPNLSPTRWNFTIHRNPGLFTDTIVVHADVPSLIPPTAPSSSDPWGSAGESFGRAMLLSMLTVNTELKLPGTIKSTNGEQTPDGYIRFTHPLMQPSSIDIVDEVPDVPHIAFAILLAIAGAITAVILLVRGRSARAAPPLAAG